uniref:Uncharacterized protein n=1 Tax=Coccolithus braarudii TaxID=221442 RepID=A0A7S0Q2K2_9EUKA|mmetsp:Transcript_30258/g.65038  ORF Transcript_30258/g.65038 Transcript_30258/m.65038 type:complete len:924 (+) Transcript_30258:163-2934(+)
MLATLLCVLIASTQAAILGIDFGGRFIKVGIIQPSKGIELVLNEATKRKSSSCAGFNSMEERVYGDESYNLIGKLPHKQFVLSKLLLGKNISSDEIKSFGEKAFPYTFVEDEDTKAAVISHGENSTFRGEELVAFVLSYAKQIAEAHAGSAIKDAVILVPPYFKATERTAMLNAAAIAQLNVLSLMHENTAFAFKYGFDKESEFKTNETTNIVFYDMGATSYKVSLASFTSIAGKKNKTTGSMVVKGVTWDSALGGRDFDQVCLDMLADAFVEKHPKLSDPRTSARAMGKLRKESERVKEVLSANQQFQVGIEALHEDRDLRMVIKRSEFEERAAHLWPRLVPPLERLLEQANISKSEIHRVEIVGGATRIPKVKEAAIEFFGMKTSASLNGDEAGALGATLYAAKLSTSFRLRDFTITDAHPHPISVKLGSDSDTPAEGEGEGEEGEEGKGPKPGKDKLLFKANTKFPHKKLITMSRTDDLLVSLSYGEPSSDEKEPISIFNVSGVAAALKRLSTTLRTPTGKPKVSVTFSLTSSGLMEVSKAEVALEMLETYDDYEVVPMNETEIAEADAKAAEEKAAADEEKAAADAEKAANETDAEPVQADAAEPDAAEPDAAEPDAAEIDPESANATEANATNASVTRTKTVKVQKQRKRMHYSQLSVTSTSMTAVAPLNSTHIAVAVAANKKLLEAEELRRLNAEAKNQLESYIIDTRDKMSSDEVVEQVSTEEERDTIREEFSKMEDWLYEEGMDLAAGKYRTKKRELEKLAAPVFLRATEMEARPRVVQGALDAVNFTLTLLTTWAAERPEVTEAERETVSGMCANFTQWLDGVQEAQAEKPLSEAPAFLSSEVTAKLEPLEREVRRLIKKPKPRPPKKPKGDKNATSASASNATNSSDAEAPPEPAPEPAAAADDDELPPHDEL